jgi:hypothetical protein
MFADLLRTSGGRLYGLISAIIGRDNVGDTGKIQMWARKNSDVIKYCVFTIAGHKTGNADIEIPDVVDALHKVDPGFCLNTYLGGVDSSHLHWAQSFMFRGRPIYPWIVRILATTYRMATGHHVSLLPVGAFRFADFFTTVIVRPHRKGTVDFCESCPDQTVMWYETNGERHPVVVHSCVTPDLLGSGSSREEADLVQFVENHPDKADRAVNRWNGINYSAGTRIVDVYRCPAK